jgi:hypothetical protein
MADHGQNRLVGWRLNLLRQASDMPKGVAQTLRYFGVARIAAGTAGLFKRLGQEITRYGCDYPGARRGRFA